VGETNGDDNRKLNNGSQKTRANSEDGQSEDYRVRPTKVSMRYFPDVELLKLTTLSSRHCSLAGAGDIMSPQDKHRQPD
jgi:hypothetical protein